MNPKELRTAWMAKWRKALDDHEFRMSNPEAYRTLRHWDARDMLAAGVIDEMEKLEMDELVSAAYWHAVEELIVPIDRYKPSGHYDVMPRDGSPASVALPMAPIVRQKAPNSQDSMAGCLKTSKACGWCFAMAGSPGP